MRLSRIASNFLKDNIADLSDQTRPTKLADRFQELYCNEWSGAYEDLTKSWNISEKQAIQILVDLIKFSSELSHATKPFKYRRKKMFENFLPDILLVFIYFPHFMLFKKEEIKKSRGDTGKNGTLEHSKKIQQYIDLSSELCWLMCIQDPKVHLYTECRKGSVFDEANFSAYTVRGTVVDFLVWPSLHLHKGGALLKKGGTNGKGGRQTKKTNYSSGTPKKFV